MFCPRFDEEKTDCKECHYVPESPDVCCKCGELMFEKHLPHSGGVIHRLCPNCDKQLCPSCTALQERLALAVGVITIVKEFRKLAFPTPNDQWRHIFHRLDLIDEAISVYDKTATNTPIGLVAVRAVDLDMAINVLELVVQDRGSVATAYAWFNRLKAVQSGLKTKPRK